MANEQRHRDEQELQYIKDYDHGATWDHLREQQRELARERNERQHGEVITLEEHEAEQDE